MCMCITGKCEPTPTGSPKLTRREGSEDGMVCCCLFSLPLPPLVPLLLTTTTTPSEEEESVTIFDRPRADEPHPPLPPPLPSLSPFIDSFRPFSLSFVICKEKMSRNEERVRTERK